jgi:hypothetical protein
MLAFSEILKSRMPKKDHESKGFRHELAEKILDIVLIIISVYIALFVESWAERRHDRVRLYQYYENFTTEIRQDITDLKSEQQDASSHMQNCKKQLEFIANNGSPDSIMKYLSKMFNSSLFASSKMLSYKSMVASGDLKLVEKLPVREALAELESAYLGIKIEEDIYLAFMNTKLTNLLENEFDLAANKPLDPLFYKKVKYKNIVVEYEGLNAARYNQYVDALKIASNTLKIIEDEIKNK